MTAILVYFEKVKNRAIICCDNIAITPTDYEIADKCYCLFNRFYIAVCGPNMLCDAILCARDYEQYDNITKPQTIDNILSILNNLYQIRVETYKKKSKKNYINDNKSQEAIIYDLKENNMYHINFGTPFNEKTHLKFPKYSQLSDGFHGFAFFKQFDKPSVDKEKFLSNPKEIANEQFLILDKKIEKSIINEHSLFANEGKHRHKVGTIGSYFERNQEKIVLESAFKTYKEIFEIYEKKNKEYLEE